MSSLKLTIALLFLSTLTFGQLRVTATASMIADMAENIGGELIDVKSIVPIGGDPHIYEPTPADTRLVSESDLILKNGLTFEGWLNELIEFSGTKAEVVLVTENVKPIESLKYKNAADPHAWMVASNGVLYAERIKDALIKLDPENADIYTFNFNLYKKELEMLDAYIKEAIQTIPESKRVLITSHDAFQYYGRAYGLQLESIIGTSTEAQAQTSDVMRVQKVIKDQNIPAVFVESTINPKLLKQLAADNHVKIGGKLYSDSLGERGGEAGTYIDMLKHNTDTIVKALSDDTSSTPEVTEDNKGNRVLILLGILIAVAWIIFFILKSRKHAD